MQARPNPFPLVNDWLPAPRPVTWPWAEWVGGGAVVGAFAGLLAGPIAGEMEGAVLLSFALAPFFAVAGAAGGFVAGRRGWRAVRPLAWAAAAGVLLGVDEPLGWLAGGAVGGLLNGALRRSFARAGRGAFTGALLGGAGWTACTAYLLALCAAGAWLAGE